VISKTCSGKGIYPPGPWHQKILLPLEIYLKKTNIKTKTPLNNTFGGESGIRTHEPLSRHGFPSRSVQPLRHLSLFFIHKPFHSLLSRRMSVEKTCYPTSFLFSPKRRNHKQMSITCIRSLERSRITRNLNQSIS
jgi:hypothetical protein